MAIIMAVARVAVEMLSVRRCKRNSMVENCPFRAAMGSSADNEPASREIVALWAWRRCMSPWRVAHVSSLC